MPLRGDNIYSNFPSTFSESLNYEVSNDTVLRKYPKWSDWKWVMALSVVFLPFPCIHAVEPCWLLEFLQLLLSPGVFDHMFPRVLCARGHLCLSYWNEHTKRAVSQKWRLRRGSGHSHFSAADSTFYFALKLSISSSKSRFGSCTVQQSSAKTEVTLSWIWRVPEKRARLMNLKSDKNMLALVGLCATIVLQNRLDLSALNEARTSQIRLFDLCQNMLSWLKNRGNSSIIGALKIDMDDIWPIQQKQHLSRTGKQTIQQLPLKYRLSA